MNRNNYKENELLIREEYGIKKDHLLFNKNKNVGKSNKNVYALT